MKPKSMWVLTNYVTGKLIGIFSTKRLGRRAATELFKTVCPDLADKKPEETADGKEILWGNEEDFCICLTPWRVDKALVDAKWVILK